MIGAEIYRALNEANPSLKEAVRQHLQSPALRVSAWPEFC